MRISTAAQHASAYLAISKRYEALLKTQNQVASGKRIQTPADDPSGAVRALDLDRSLAESQQFGRNADIVRNRLSLEEQTLERCHERHRPHPHAHRAGQHQHRRCRIAQEHHRRNAGAAARAGGHRQPQGFQRRIPFLGPFDAGAAVLADPATASPIRATRACAWCRPARPSTWPTATPASTCSSMSSTATARS